MPNETTATQAAPEAASSTSTSTEAPSFTQETPSSTVDNLPQSEGDFASWLSDRLEKFEKGEETAPWEQKQEVEGEAKEKAEEEVKPEAEEKTEPETGEEEQEEADDDGEDTKNMSAAAGAKFKELKAELKNYKSKVAELEKAAQQSQSVEQNSEEIEQLRTRLAEYEQEIAITRVEATPEFKRAVIEPTRAILDTASSMAERYKIDARKLVNALREESVSEGSDALTELAADFSERDRVRLYRMADDLTEVSRRRDFLRENASKAYAEQQERAKVEEANAEKRYRERAAHTASQVWNETFAENPAFSSLDKEVVQQIQNAGSEADLLDSTPDVRAYAVYAGVAFPHVVKQLSVATEKVAELEKALSKYKKATPKVSGNTDTSPAVVEDGGFLDAIEKRFSLG